MCMYIYMHHIDIYIYSQSSTENHVRIDLLVQQYSNPFPGSYR